MSHVEAAINALRGENEQRAAEAAEARDADSAQRDRKQANVCDDKLKATGGSVCARLRSNIQACLLS